ncbi:hypothetical protein GYMLUDRAFT_104492, partial [Collybiopsis luxurians FD-317 M1]
EVLAQIHMCICQVIVPSWVSKPPFEVGLKAGGTLKADNWCMLFGLYIPLALLKRLIGKLQKILTNHRSRQFEMTLLHSYAKGVGFCRWLLHSDCPPLLKQCHNLLNKAY